MQDFKAINAHMVCGLDYNQLKRRLLRVLADSGPLDSSSLLQKLISSAGEQFEIHAVRMALMRYYRQGLLRRSRSGGQFRYTLSGRGFARLQWLEAQVRHEDVGPSLVPNDNS